MSKKVLAVLMTFILVLAACSSGNTGGGKQESQGNPSNQENKETPKSEGNENKSKTLVIANGSSMSSFDIHNHNSAGTEAIHVNMFNYLIRNQGTLGFAPDLAESWEIVDDTTWNFKLKQGVKFHNGDELTAEDVKFTLERVARDESLREYNAYRTIKEVVVKSDYEFDIITHSSEPILLNRLSRIGSGILPKNYIEKEGWETFLKKPVGTGPYMLKEWLKDDRVVLTPFKDYFGGEPKWEEVVFRTVPEDSTRVAELLTQGVDIIENVPPTDIARVESSGQTSIAVAPTQRVMMLALRTEGNYITADSRVRAAIELAIDKQAIVDNLLEGYGTITRTRTTPGNTGANESLYGVDVYNIERAKELMKEAGYEKGAEMTFSATNGRYLKDKETAELIAAMLEEIGIRVKLEVLETSAFTQKHSEKAFGDMFMISFGNSMFDASLALQRLISDRAAGETDYKNSRFDELFAAAETNMNLEERAQQHQEMQSIIAEERPDIYLYQYEAIYGVNNRVTFKPRLDSMYYVDEIELN